MSEVVEVAGEARKPIDIRSSTISHNVTGEALDALPQARSFVAIAATSPSVNLRQIEGGTQVNGASSAENTYTIDGVVTNSLLKRRFAAGHDFRVPPGGRGVERAGDERQHDVAHEPGGSIGGPIAKNRLFFVGSYFPRAGLPQTPTAAGGRIRRTPPAPSTCGSAARVS